MHGDPVNGADPTGTLDPVTGLPGAGPAGCNYTDCNGTSDKIVVTAAVGDNYSNDMMVFYCGQSGCNGGIGINSWAGQTPPTAYDTCMSNWMDDGRCGGLKDGAPPKLQQCNQAKTNLNALGDDFEKFGTAMGLGGLGLLTSAEGGEVLFEPALWANRVGTAASELGTALKGYAAGGTLGAAYNIGVAAVEDFTTGKFVKWTVGAAFGKNVLEQITRLSGLITEYTLDYAKSCKE